MSKNNKIIISICGIIIIIVIILAIRSSTEANLANEATGTATTTQQLPGIQVTEAPWQAETDHLGERLLAIGLPALSQEGTALHTHQHLDIYVHGKPVAIPAGIGINEIVGFISPIHVHDTTGIIHVESPTIQKFTLGQYFDIWGVRLTASSIGGYANDASSTLLVYVNGKKFIGDPRDVELTAHEEIAMTFGSPQESPKIPTSYSFPAGL